MAQPNELARQDANAPQAVSVQMSICQAALSRVGITSPKGEQESRRPPWGKVLMNSWHNNTSFLCLTSYFPQISELSLHLIDAGRPMTTSDTRSMLDWANQLSSMTEGAKLAVRLHLLTLLLEVSNWCLTRWGWHEMGTILLMTFSNSFSWVKNVAFWSKF